MISLDAILAKCEIGDCWTWQAAKNEHGYGFLNDRGKMRKVHRVVWESLVGPIPTGLEIDHLCKVRNCCNPDHLRTVTHRQNLAASRGRSMDSHCKYGHEMIDGSVYVAPNGSRRCNICKKARRKEQYQQFKKELV